ncbi:MAG: prohibitin family protein [Pseudomonadota bacterium]
MKTVDSHSTFRSFMRRQMPYLSLLFFLFCFAVVFLFHRIIITINPGELGVLWKRLGGGTEIETVYREGLHLILPINKMYIYNVRKQQISDSIDTLTVDGLTVKVKYTVRYFLTADTLPLLHQRVGPDYAEVVIRPEVRAAIRTVFGQYKPEEIYTTQRAIQERVSSLSKIQLQARFVALDSVPIESITLPPKISEAIESKMALQQLEGEYLYRLSIAKKEAERKHLEADGVKLYNDTILKSLTPSLLEWYGIQATESLAKSPNSKTVVIGSGKSGLPIILGKD